MVVVVLALGDGAAYIGGKTFGKRKLPWNSEKTWVGSLSFIAVSGPIATLAYMALADADGRHWKIAAACGFAAAICGSMAESLPVKLTDNLRVGVSALLAVTVTQYALVEGMTVSMLTLLVTALFVYALVRSLFIFAAMRNHASLLFRAAATMRRNLLVRIYELPGAGGLDETPGEVVSRFRDDIEHVVEPFDLFVDFVGALVAGSMMG